MPIESGLGIPREAPPLMSVVHVEGITWGARTKGGMETRKITEYFWLSGRSCVVLLMEFRDVGFDSADHWSVG